VALHLQVQPDVAARLFSDPVLEDQGLLSRICVVAPDSNQGQRFWKEPRPEHHQDALTYVQQLEKLLRLPLPLKPGARNELAPPALQFTEGARNRWITFVDEVERRMGPGCDLEPISGFAAKLPEHAARIAGVLTKFHDPGALLINDQTLSNGITISLHYAATALRLHGASRISSDLQDAQILLDWARARSDNGLISLPDVVQTGPNRIRETATARRLIQILVQHRHLQVAGPRNVHGKHRRDVWQLAATGEANA
jgi:hypothetical protein